MKTFKHSGDAGDIVYSLAAVRVLGKGDFYLSRAPFTRVPMDHAAFMNIAPLLDAQPYIAITHLHRDQDVDVDLDTFRGVGTARDNICGRHLRACGLPEQLMNEKWLEVRTPNMVSPVVINRTARYRNPSFPWKRIVDHYGTDRCIFVGTKEEHRSFTADVYKIPIYFTKNLLELAQVIAGAKLFIGNQSCAYAIAEGMKKPVILEGYLRFPNCTFKRPDAQQVFGDRVTLPEI